MKQSLPNETLNGSLALSGTAPLIFLEILTSLACWKKEHKGHYMSHWPLLQVSEECLTQTVIYDITLLDYKYLKFHFGVLGQLLFKLCVN